MFQNIKLQIKIKLFEKHQATSPHLFYQFPWIATLTTSARNDAEKRQISGRDAPHNDKKMNVINFYYFATTNLSHLQRLPRNDIKGEVFRPFIPRVYPNVSLTAAFL
jgi:hypothetical protein